MAANHQRRREIEALIRRIESSRLSLGGEVRSLRAKLKAPKRWKQKLVRAVSRNPLATFGGMAGAGLLLSRLRRRPKAAKRKRGVAGFILGAAFAALKPTLTRFATNELRKYLVKHYMSRRTTATSPAPARRIS